MIVGIKASFDPISQLVLDDAKAFAKQYGKCVLFVEEDGVLPYAKRVELVKKAIRPFSKIDVVMQEEGIQFICKSEYEQQEKRIQSGKFYLAAQGIRSTLVNDGLYLNEVVDANCNAHRAHHSKQVAKLAVELANVHGVDLKDAYIAGMLHDVTKCKEDAWNQSIMDIYYPHLSSYSNKVYHSFTAVQFLKKNLGLYNQTILNAIYHHTLGTGKSDLAKIIYIADKCERSRNYDTEYEIEQCKKDLDKGFELVLNEANA